jgi:hypothetical protein
MQVSCVDVLSFTKWRQSEIEEKNHAILEYLILEIHDLF